MNDQTNSAIENKPNDKEFNFRMQAAQYEKKIELERQEKVALQKQLQEIQSKKHHDDDDDEPYVDMKKLDRKLANFEQKNSEQTQQQINKAVSIAIQQDRNEQWMKNNPDYNEIMNPENIERFYQHDKEHAETILRMPEGFDRQKLVFKSIKALGLHKPEAKQPSIQDKIDANKRSPYYQPSGVGSAPYASQGDFSPSGQKGAYQKMKDLQNKLRI
jgi:hypothetical protein